jgi:hypothetical protein
MKHSPPSLRQVTTLASGLLALAFVAGGCSSSDKTTTPPTNPPVDASNPPDPTPDVTTPPPPEMDAGSLTCGMNTCTSRIVGGQIGVACCARGGTSCGLNFTGTCIDQSDAGFTMPPPSDAGPVVPDPSCGTVSIDVGGMMFTLSGCCLPVGNCGYYVPQMTSIGCLTIDQLRGQGAPVPDAPMACSPDGGPRL